MAELLLAVALVVLAAAELVRQLAWFKKDRQRRRKR